MLSHIYFFIQLSDVKIIFTSIRLRTIISIWKLFFFFVWISAFLNLFKYLFELSFIE